MTESVTTYSLTSKDVAFYRAHKGACTNDPNPQTETIAGQLTVRVEESIPKEVNGKPIIWEKWLAPELGCFPLRTRTLIQESGAVLTSRETVFVVLGEPAASLFDIPAGFTERSPSAVFAEYDRRFPGRRQVNARTNQVLDEAYASRQ